MSVLTVGDLSFELKPSNRRRTLQSTVDRRGDLVLSAPPGVEESRLRKFVLEKRFWIYTKLAEKGRLQKTVPTKTFVDGEGFLYLGRSYRLRLADEQDVPLKLLNGRFILRRDLVDNARAHLVQWYVTRAKIWLWGKIQDYVARMQVKPVGLKVQDLGYRWGSCGKGDWLYFHWKTILLPPRIGLAALIVSNSGSPGPAPTSVTRATRTASVNFGASFSRLIGRTPGKACRACADCENDTSLASLNQFKDVDSVRDHDAHARCQTMDSRPASSAYRVTIQAQSKR